MAGHCRRHNRRTIHSATEDIHALRARRLELGMSQEDVARKTGFAEWTISNWERGARSPLANATAWANALGCTIKLEPLP